jgi:hypothetical protein
MMIATRSALDMARSEGSRTIVFVLAICAYASAESMEMQV